MSKKRFILTVVLPVCISLLIGILIIVLNNNFILNSRAIAIVASEKSNFNSQISELKKERDKLEGEIADYDKTLADNSLLTEEVEALKSELEHYVSDVDAAKARSEKLKVQITEKKTYLDSLSKIESETEGDSLKLSDGEYKCPSELPSGRYKAEGTGKLYRYSISNSLTLKEDLSTIDTHSYTFDLEAGETIKIEGTLTLTELTANKEKSE